jgi:fructan beta-fructosidase
MSTDEVVKLHLFLDVSSVELFADDGEVVMTELFFPDAIFDQLKLYAKEGEVELQSGRAIDLHSIWGEKPALLTSE